MKLPLPPDFFAPVRLSHEETAQLQMVEAQLLDAYLDRYEECALGNNGAVEGKHWKFVRQRDGVRVYKRRTRRRMWPHHDQENDRRGRQIEHSHLPGILIVGSVEGTVEDILYGTMWDSREDRMARAYFTGDGIADAAVLHTLEGATTLDPFRSLAVKWTLKKAPTASVLVKDRDFCFLGSTGVIRTQNGDKVGYELRHSIKFPSCPRFENSSVVRAQMYFCSFFRQLKNGRVEVFHQGSYDASGDLLSMLATKSAVASFANFTKILDCSFAKKLMRAIRRSEEREEAMSISSAQESVDDERRCGMCLSRLGSALKRKCAVCRHFVCRTCSMRKEVRAISHTKVLARCFCRSCAAKVLRDEAVLYAIGDIESRHLFAKNPSSKWAHDDIDDEEILSSTHTIVLVAPDSSTYNAGLLLGKKKQSEPQLSKYGAPLGSYRNMAASFRRNPESPRRRLGSNAPDVLLRSDAGRRNWDYSTSALSLRSPQRRDNGVTIVHRPKKSPHHRLATKSPRTPTHTPRSGRGIGAGAAGGLPSTDGTKSKRQRQFFRELYQKSD